MMDDFFFNNSSGMDSASVSLQTNWLDRMILKVFSNDSMMNNSATQVWRNMRL